MDDPTRDDPRKTPFLQILLYTFGFMGAIALLAAAFVWLLRRFAEPKPTGEPTIVISKGTDTGAAWAAARDGSAKTQRRAQKATNKRFLCKGFPLASIVHEKRTQNSELRTQNGGGGAA